MCASSSVLVRACRLCRQLLRGALGRCPGHGQAIASADLFEAIGDALFELVQGTGLPKPTAESVDYDSDVEKLSVGVALRAMAARMPARRVQ